MCSRTEKYSRRQGRLSEHTFTLLLRRLNSALPDGGPGRARLDRRTEQSWFTAGVSAFTSAASDRRARFRTGTKTSERELGGAKGSHRRMEDGTLSVGSLSGSGRMNRRVNGCRACRSCQSRIKVLYASETNPCRTGRSAETIKSSRGLTRSAPSVRARGVPGVLTNGDLVRVGLYASGAKVRSVTARTP